MTHHSNAIETYRDRLFHCQIKAVRHENPEMSEADVYERAVQLHAKIVEAEEGRLRTGWRKD